nr:two-component system, OmpR family, alkaline phosphatase synthesis response regulator PhoP [Candidatus Cloacimonadota bacterium]
MQKLIYIVEDEPDIAELIAIKLQSAGFDTRIFDLGTSMLRALSDQICDLLVLDLMLPDMDGFQICKNIREKPDFASIPIIMLTARTAPQDKVQGLELGADDYLGKPFDGKELVARVNAVLRRCHTKPEKIYRVHPALTIDLMAHEANIDGKRLDLTLTEFRILKLFITNPGRVWSRSEILDYLWGTDKIVIERSVDVHIKNLRDKIGDYAPHIQNVRGVGYCFVENP